MKPSNMSNEKLANITKSLTAACASEERRTPGARCGFVFLLVEMEPGSDEVRMRTATMLPIPVAVGALQQALLDISTKGMRPDYSEEVDPGMTPEDRGVTLPLTTETKQ